jgi:hypothetical protein
MKFFAGISTAFDIPLADVVVILGRSEQRESRETNEQIEYASDTF